MSNRGSIILGELQGKLDLLDIACHRCERRGRVSLARLIEEHGADTGLPDLWESLSDDCANATSGEQVEDHSQVERALGCLDICLWGAERTLVSDLG